ncbi:MAG: hypothetical protein AB7J28_03440 [Hyphomonadaceae bacterium]
MERDWERHARAYLIAPIAASAATAILMLELGIGLLALAAAYLLLLPLFCAWRGIASVSGWNSALSHASVGALLAVPCALATALPFSIPVRGASWWEFIQYWPVVVTALGAGIAFGLCFWLIRRPDRDVSKRAVDHGS